MPQSFEFLTRGSYPRSLYLIRRDAAKSEARYQARRAALLRFDARTAGSRAERMAARIIARVYVRTLLQNRAAVNPRAFLAEQRARAEGGAQ